MIIVRNIITGNNLIKPNADNNDNNDNGNNNDYDDDDGDGNHISTIYISVAWSCDQGYSNPLHFVCYGLKFSLYNFLYFNVR